MTAFYSEQWKPRVPLRVLTRPRYTSSKRDPEQRGIGQMKGYDVFLESPSKTNKPQALATHAPLPEEKVISHNNCWIYRKSNVFSVA